MEGVSPVVSEGVILSERGAEVSSAYPIEALWSPQNVDEVRGVAGAFIPQSSDCPNVPFGGAGSDRCFVSIYYFKIDRLVLNVCT